MATGLDTYLRRSGRLDLDGLDLGAAFADRPLSEGGLACLQYMHDVESHTACYLRDVLATRAHEDPDVTTFLTMWSYEEHWHGEALGAVLAAHGRPAGPLRVREVRRSLGRADGLRPAAFALGSALAPDLVALHMVWGAVNERTTQAGYGLLARREAHPVLAELLARIMRQEGGHIDFYTGEARRRLEGRRAVQRVTRLALARLWRPVGHRVRPAAETAFVVGHLFGGPGGAAAAARIDRHVDRLPGLAGLHLVASAVARHGPVGAA